MVVIMQCLLPSLDLGLKPVCDSRLSDRYLVMICLGKNHQADPPDVVNRSPNWLHKMTCCREVPSESVVQRTFSLCPLVPTGHIWGVVDHKVLWSREELDSTAWQSNLTMLGRLCAPGVPYNDLMLVRALSSILVPWQPGSQFDGGKTESYVTVLYALFTFGDMAYDSWRFNVPR